MSRSRLQLNIILVTTVLIIAGAWAIRPARSMPALASDSQAEKNSAVLNAVKKVQQGQDIFRFDTFGDQEFWGGQLQLHQAIAGDKPGGVGPGVSPKTALAVGLKVDIDALPKSLVAQIEQGKVNLDDPGVTLA